jgi:hypothetical protein
LLTLGILLLAALIGRTFDPSWESSLKQLLVPYADLYLGFFSHPLAGILLTGIMFVAGATVVFWYWFARLRPVRRMLRIAIKGVKSLSEMPPGTLRALEALDDVFTRAQYLNTDWRHYKSTLLISEHPERLWSSYRPNAYFNLSNLNQRGLGLTLLKSIPGYFVGVGLLFTFMGLVAGLYFASRGLMAADLPTARLALVQLLRTSTVKFSTSVAGLGISIVISIWSRVIIDGLERLMSQFCAALEDLVPLAPLHLATPLRPLELNEAGIASKDMPSPVGRRLASGR